ncbi:hypothetical protein IX38_20355 [Chryseobacterium luteum]|uniref:Uncharacterized protein n=1 Tax=Chryseobacterium luteum TaxID=421531 RepID=A0A085YZK8_9FLAO|nr:hypothetical protein IX38_20355 [Chryseobacterium luteum]
MQSVTQLMTFLTSLQTYWKSNGELKITVWRMDFGFFELTFYSHTQQHIPDRLNFMKQKNG